MLLNVTTPVTFVFELEETTKRTDANGVNVQTYLLDYSHGVEHDTPQLIFLMLTAKHI